MEGRIHPAWELIEPAAQTKAATAFPESPPGEHGIELSKAISLKRIADALAGGIAEQIKAGLSAPLNNYGEGIGEAIQGQIVRGNRGIDY